MINEFAREVHENSVRHGWWDEERELPEIIALCHSELSEALEAYRNGEEMVWMNGEKPDGIAVEMCDCIIRILDYLAEENIDIDYVLGIKHGYRLFMHSLGGQRWREEQRRMTDLSRRSRSAGSAVCAVRYSSCRIRIIRGSCARIVKRHFVK